MRFHRVCLILNCYLLAATCVPLPERSPRVPTPRGEVLREPKKIQAPPPAPSTGKTDTVSLRPLPPVIPAAKELKLEESDSKSLAHVVTVIPFDPAWAFCFRVVDTPKLSQLDHGSRVLSSSRSSLVCCKLESGRGAHCDTIETPW